MIATALVLAAFAIVTIVTDGLVSRSMHERMLSDIASKTHQVVDMIDVYDATLREESSHSIRFLASLYPDNISADPSQTVMIGTYATPRLKSADRTVNLDFSFVDQFMAVSGGVATVFAKMGDDFVRVTTSLKKENGERAVGTLLDRTHPGYATLIKGEPFQGKAMLFGKDYMTTYDPIKDISGQVIGVLFVGLDIAKNLALLKQKIKSIKIGDTGYIYVVAASPGESLGKLLVHPAKEGQSVLDSKDAAGNAFVREMLKNKKGVIRYPWLNSELGDAVARDRVVAYETYPNWNWLVAGGVYEEEFNKDRDALRKIAIVLALAAALLLALLLFVGFRKLVRNPLNAAVGVARKVASGDLTTRLETGSRDETGQLMNALKDMHDSLAAIVGTVRTSAATVNQSAHEITLGNAELSQRAEEQASTLEETAASTETLTAMVQQNAGHAEHANQLAQNAEQIAAKGDAMMADVVQMMTAIKHSASKISDIISTINAIAFQTNILALNAAVEAPAPASRAADLRLSQPKYADWRKDARTRRRKLKS